MSLYNEALHDLVEDLNPSNVWNTDETSLSLAQVVARKGSKVIPGRTSNSRESVAVLPCVNAAGQAMPPLIVAKGKTSRSLRSYNTHEVQLEPFGVSKQMLGCRMNFRALGLKKCSLKIAEKHALNY